MGARECSSVALVSSDIVQKQFTARLSELGGICAFFEFVTRAGSVQVTWIKHERGRQGIDLTDMIFPLREVVLAGTERHRVLGFMLVLRVVEARSDSPTCA